MGQGAWTVLAQTAADGLSLPLERVEFRAADSRLPDAGIAGGSAHTATAGIAIHAAGADVITKLAALATGDEHSPLFGAGNAGVIARAGRLHRRDDESRSEGFREILVGIKGVGEIGITGSAGAIANAVWHATGRRVQHFPITPDKLL